MLELHLVEATGQRRLATLGRAPLLIGRSRSNDVVLDSEQISGRHVRIWLDGEQIRVRDLGSRNGTEINGERLTDEVEVSPGDEIALGQTVILRVVQRGVSFPDEGPTPGPALSEALAELPPGLAGRLKRESMGTLRELDSTRWALARLPLLIGAGRRSAVLQTVVDEVRAATEAPLVAALVWSGAPEDGEISGSAHTGDLTRMLSLDAISTSIVGDVFQEGRAAWTDDAQLDRRFGDRHSVQALALQSLGCVPLGTGGVLYLSDPSVGGRFGENLRGRIEALCALASSFVDHARAPAPAQALPGMVAASQAMAEVFDSVRAFAPMPWPILILGETGVGKERVAHAVHELSGREGPFVPVNCGALADDLALSQLFGHEKGSFTGADRQHVGFLERAGTGTLFLDEVGELSPTVQIRLLRVLQDGQFHRLGGEAPQQLRARIIAATHRPLDEAEDRQIRDDLYHRLAACVVRVPPLRDRPEDIPLLAEHLLERLLTELSPQPHLELSPESKRFLSSRAYPGNVRELENVLRTGVARCLAGGEATLQPGHMSTPGTSPGTGSAEEAVEDLHSATLAFQLRRVNEMLELCQGNRAEAARRLGVSRQFLYRLLAKETDG
ncbi:MAG TPA: FHA domain-containing protein [Deltaproteobacteria bacterium]|nr:FHA domain-containing protein [Deltaproteobacteria bacterium]